MSHSTASLQGEPLLLPDFVQETRVVFQSVPGEKLVLSSLPEEGLEIDREGDGLLIRGDDGSEIFIADFFVVGESTLPTLVLPDGMELSGDDLQRSFDLDISPAAGPSANVVLGGGVNEYKDSPDPLVEGIEALGKVDSAADDYSAPGGYTVASGAIGNVRGEDFTPGGESGAGTGPGGEVEKKPSLNIESSTSTSQGRATSLTHNEYWEKDGESSEKVGYDGTLSGYGDINVKTDAKHSAIGLYAQGGKVEVDSSTLTVNTTAKDPDNMQFDDKGNIYYEVGKSSKGDAMGIAGRGDTGSISVNVDSLRVETEAQSIGYGTLAYGEGGTVDITANKDVLLKVESSHEAYAMGASGAGSTNTLKAHGQLHLDAYSEGYNTSSYDPSTGKVGGNNSYAMGLYAVADGKNLIEFSGGNPLNPEDGALFTINSTNDKGAAHGIHANTGGENHIESNGSLTINLEAGTVAYGMFARNGGSNLLDFSKAEEGVTVIFQGTGVSKIYAMYADSTKGGDFASNEIRGSEHDDVLNLTGNIHAEKNSTNIIDTGAGDDYVSIKGDFYATNSGANKILLGDGDDTLVIDGSVSKAGALAVDGGEGFDTLILKADSWDDFVSSYKQWLQNGEIKGIDKIVIRGVDVSEVDQKEIDDIFGNIYNDAGERVIPEFEASAVLPAMSLMFAEDGIPGLNELHNEDQDQNNEAPRMDSASKAHEPSGSSLTLSDFGSSHSESDDLAMLELAIKLNSNSF